MESKVMGKRVMPFKNDDYSNSLNNKNINK
jgi:hypothetical protein